MTLRNTTNSNLYVGQIHSLTLLLSDEKPWCHIEAIKTLYLRHLLQKFLKMSERNITPHYISSCDIDPILFFSNLAVEAEPSRDVSRECEENESLVNVIEELCGLRELDWKTNSPFNAISQLNYPLFAVSRNGRMIAPGSDMSAYTDQIVCHNDSKTFLPIKHSEHAEIIRSNTDHERKKVALSVDVTAACSNEIRPVTNDNKQSTPTFRTKSVSINMNVSPSPMSCIQDEGTDSEETVQADPTKNNSEQTTAPNQIPSVSSSPFSEESTSSSKSSATSTETAKKKAPSTAKRKRASSVSPAHSASLQEYGFVDTFAYVQSTTLRRTNRVHTYEQIKQALLRYQELNGNILVPYKFRIPVGSPIWSEDSAGIWLGKVVRNIRCGHCYCTKKAELESLGFVFAKQPKGNYAKVELALLTYQEIHGTMDVKYTFKVPVGDSSWPLETWGMKLGKSVRNIRCGHNYRDRQADLAKLGLKFKKTPVGPTSVKPDPSACPPKIEPDPDPTSPPVISSTSTIPTPPSEASPAD